MREGEEQETGEQRREQREEAEAQKKRKGEKQLKLRWDGMMGLCCVAM